MNEPEQSQEKPQPSEPALPQPPAGEPPAAGGWADYTQPEVRPPAPQTLAYAGAGVRLLALVIDVIALLILLFAAGVIVGLLEVATDSFDTLSGSPTENAIAQVIFVILSFAYFATGWVRMRSTLGQRLLRIQVGRAADGASVTWGSATIRWVLLTLGPLGIVIPLLNETLVGLIGLLALGWWVALLVSTIVNPMNRGFHDRLSNTLVVQRVKQLV